ncbi:MAG: VWA domain-containing protein [Thermoanaerobaculia bacterium]|jgi:VWFA-related protein
MRRLFAFALACALSCPSVAAAQAGGPVARSVEVSVTNVDVVVTDSKGQPITDLTAADFEVRQDGVVQPLTNFSFIRNLPPATPATPLAPAPPPAARADLSQQQAARAHLIVFLDEIHLATIDRNRALRSLREYLPTVIGPGVEAQLVTWDRGLRIRGPFTSDVPVLLSMLETLEKESSTGDVPIRERDRVVQQIDSALLADARTRDVLLSQAVSSLRAWCDAQSTDVDATMGALRASLGAVAGVEGRKVLFFVTQRLTPSPGRDLFDYIQTAGGQSIRNSRSLGVDDLSYRTFDRSSSFRGLASAANAAGVSLVTIEASGLDFDTTFSAQSGSSLGRLDEGIASLDMKAALGLLADETGGATIQDRNNLALALKSLEADWTAYYSLGYESPDAKPGKPRSIKVSVSRPGARARSRRTVIERTPEEKVADAVLSGVHIPRTVNPLRASLRIGTPKKSGKMWLVPLDFRIPFDKLTLVPQGGRARGAVLFTAVAASPDGRISPVTTERAPIDVPEADLAALSGKSFTYSATLKVRPGEQVLSTALTDEVSRLSSFVQPHVLIGDKPGTR